MQEPNVMDNNNKITISLGKLPTHVYSKHGFDYAESGHFLVIINGELWYEQNHCKAIDLISELTNTTKIEALYQNFSGQFWCVVYNKISKELIIVNDHFAIVPCFYALANNQLYISDSLKYLTTQLSVSIAEQSLFNYIYFHCIPSPNTIFKEISKLEPGNSINVKQDATYCTELLYKPHFSQQPINEKKAQQQCRKIISSAVKKHIEVDTGAFLSGGLDSSTVAGMLASHQEQARTFSIGFDIPAYDETAYAKITANHFKTDHQVLYLQPESVVDKFIDVAQYFDEPFGNSSAMATYFCAVFAKENGISRLLAGDGGDELFAGNTRYAKQKIFTLYDQVGVGLQGLAKSIFYQPLIEKLPVANKVASYIRQADIGLPDRLQSYNFVNRFGAGQMFNADFLEAVEPLQPRDQQRKRYEECDSDNIVDKMLYVDWKVTLADNDLVKVGRMCEMAGIDVRYPLLDKSLVDFSCTIPANSKLPRKKLRHFYKESMKGFLANETLTKPKHGFGLPFGMWMKNTPALTTLALDSLLAFKKRKIIQDSLIDKVLDAHLQQHAGYFGELIWVLVVLELWLDKQ